jgi:frataxin-like iron-binding protein CyaY
MSYIFIILYKLHYIKQNFAMIVYNELTLQRTSSYNKVPTLHQSQTSVKLSIPVTSGKKYMYSTNLWAKNKSTLELTNIINQK